MPQETGRAAENDVLESAAGSSHHSSINFTRAAKAASGEMRTFEPLAGGEAADFHLFDQERRLDVWRSLR